MKGAKHPAIMALARNLFGRSSSLLHDFRDATDLLINGGACSRAGLPQKFSVIIFRMCADYVLNSCSPKF